MLSTQPPFVPLDSEAKWAVAQDAIKNAFPMGDSPQPSEVCTAIAYAVQDMLAKEGHDPRHAAVVANNVADTIEADFEIYLAIFQAYLTAE